MLPPSRRIAFLRDCYRADNRESSVLDVLDERVQQRFLPGREELLTGEHDLVPVDAEWAEPLRKAALVYRREKSLLYGALCVTGTAPGGKRLAAPLIFFPAELQEAQQDGIGFLSIDREEQRVNLPLLEAVAGDDEALAETLQKWGEGLPQAPLRLTDVYELGEALAQHLPHLDHSAMRGFPLLVEPDAPGARSRLRLLPASCVALVPNSPASGAVLYELDRLEEEESFSPPVQQLLSRQPPGPAPKRRPRRPAPVPAVPCDAQLRGLRSAATAPLTVLVGPPGTGKTFTLAAIALEHMYRGESVLMVTRTREALQAAARKLESLVGEALGVVRGGRKEVAESISALLDGVAATAGAAHGAPSRARLRGLERQVGRLERAFDRRCRIEQRWTAWDGRSGVSSRLARALLRLRMGDAPDAAIDAEQAALDALVSGTAARLRAERHAALSGFLASRRPAMQTLLRGLKARTSARQQNEFAQVEFGPLLKALPVWMTVLTELQHVLPLQRELFDVVLLDEATHCDMASALPALQRARRAVVTGDGRQLRHLSFLSRDRQRALALRHELDDAEEARLDFRDRSLLDLALDSVGNQEQVVFLDEHFRSEPAIIAFSNREFYRGALRIMTERPEPARQALQVRHVAGRRDDAGVNAAEAEALLQQLESWLAGSAQGATVGVLSPFRAQVDHLAKQLLKRLPGHLLRTHDLLVGTPYAFQGEERDAMFLSFAVGPDDHAAALRYLERPDVLNVAVTRARKLQFVFASVRPADLAEGTLLRRYLEDAAASSSPVAPAPTPPEPFAQQVLAALEARGYRTWHACTVAGHVVDVLAGRDGRMLAIDLLGGPGRSAPALHAERYRLFHRCGLAVRPLAWSEWRRSGEAALDALLDEPPTPMRHLVSTAATDEAL